MEHWKRELYQKYSSTFSRTISIESFNAFKPYGNKIVTELFPSDKSIRILDMGCGIGGFVKVFLDRGYLNVEGIDVSSESVSIANHFGIAQVHKGEIIDSLKIKDDNSFDIILYLDVLEHITRHETLCILNETYRILRPGGKVIIHAPNAEGVFGSRIRYSDITHEMAFTEKSLGQMMTYAGFTSFTCLEDQPTMHNLKGVIRRFLWKLGTFPFRVLHMAETGTYRIKLSQNILFCALKA